MVSLIGNAHLLTSGTLSVYVRRNGSKWIARFWRLDSLVSRVEGTRSELMFLVRSYLNV